MLDPRFLSYPQGRRAHELKPLVTAFANVIARHGVWRKSQTSSGVPAPDEMLYAAECGVWQGESLLLCLRIAKELGVPVQFFGLDTFAGLPELGSQDLAEAPQQAPYRQTRWFADTSLEAVQATIEQAGFAHHARLLPGLFSETLSALPEVTYSFVNIDCDLYDGHIECLEYFFPRMKPGGIIYFDDYHSEDFPMARRAIDTFMAAHPKSELVHLRFGNHAPNAMKSMIVV
jgi:hypothetical protein